MQTNKNTNYKAKFSPKVDLCQFLIDVSMNSAPKCIKKKAVNTSLEQNELCFIVFLVNNLSLDITDYIIISYRLKEQNKTPSKCISLHFIFYLTHKTAYLQKSVIYRLVGIHTSLSTDYVIDCHLFTDQQTNYRQTAALGTSTKQGIKLLAGSQSMISWQLKKTSWQLSFELPACLLAASHIFGFQLIKWEPALSNTVGL